MVFYGRGSKNTPSHFFLLSDQFFFSQVLHQFISSFQSKYDLSFFVRGVSSDIAVGFTKHRYKLKDFPTLYKLFEN